VTQKNRTHKNYIESYKDPVNFKHFESVYTHSPKFQSFKSLRRKVMFFPKHAPNDLHGVGGKLAPADQILCTASMLFCVLALTVRPE